MRGCLKHPSPSPSPDSSSSIATPPPTRAPTPPLIPPDVPSLSGKRRPSPSLTDECLSRRCVHFCSELVDKVFVADEWDRSPAHITPRLTYQDMLELKEIQRSLPHATQPQVDADLPELNARGVPRTQFLNTVPVGLVPLITPTTSPMSQPKLATTPSSVTSKLKVESSASPSSPSRPPLSPPSTPPPHISVTAPPSSPSPTPLKPPSPPPRPVEPWVPPPPPPRLPYNIPIQPRPKPRFNFLPLLETPEPPVASTPPRSNLPSSPLPTSPQGLPKTAPARTPSPHVKPSRSIPSSSSSSSQTSHTVQPTESLPSTSIGVAPVIAATSLSLVATPNQPPNPLVGQLLPPWPFSSAPSPSDSREASLEDSTHLEAELSRIWHSHSCNTDGETEAEESEAESSVVHTEAESDSESTRAVFASDGAPKVVRAPVTIATAADADDEEEGEMSLVELESGVMAFVRTPRRR